MVWRMDATGLSGLLANGEVTPMALLELSLRRLAALEPKEWLLPGYETSV